MTAESTCGASSLGDVEESLHHLDAPDRAQVKKSDRPVTIFRLRLSSTEKPADEMIVNLDDRPLGLVLSGGGARGAFQVGVWKVLSEDVLGRGKLPDVLSGTSCGAINAALIASGLSPEEMMEFWFRVADNPPVVANEAFFDGLKSAITRMLSRPLAGVGMRSRRGRILGHLLKRHPPWRPGAVNALVVAYWLTARFGAVSRILGEIPTPFLFDVEPLKENLREAIGADELRNTPVGLAVNTVDVKTGRVVRIVNRWPSKHPRV